MRVVLVSVASYQLWLHWREPAMHLARQFVDYEPGIHYPQVQVQSGSTGMNALRIYNPVKQSMEQHPDGKFIRACVPELEGIDHALIHIQSARSGAAAQAQSPKIYDLHGSRKRARRRSEKNLPNRNPYSTGG
jgi:deoxyribodipyrimidine photolyase